MCTCIHIHMHTHTHTHKHTHTHTHSLTQAHTYTWRLSLPTLSFTLTLGCSATLCPPYHFFFLTFFLAVFGTGLSSLCRARGLLSSRPRPSSPRRASRISGSHGGCITQGLSRALWRAWLLPFSTLLELLSQLCCITITMILSMSADHLDFTGASSSSVNATIIQFSVL